MITMNLPRLCPPSLNSVSDRLLRLSRLGGRSSIGSGGSAALDIANQDLLSLARLRWIAVAHPRMFDDDDPALARVRAIALAMPGAAEKISHGRPAMYTKRVFAYYGGSLKNYDEWVQHPQSIVVRPDPEDRPFLLGHERVYVPAYFGPSGWIGYYLGDEADWDEVAELIDASYRLTAPKRLLDELDAAG